MTKKQSPTVGAPTPQRTTDPVTDEVRATRPPPADAVTALRVVGTDLALALPRAKDSFTLGGLVAWRRDLAPDQLGDRGAGKPAARGRAGA